MAASSSHLNWLVVRQWNAFQLKKTNIPKPFSAVSCLVLLSSSGHSLTLVFSLPLQEPGNLMNVSSYRYSGLVHKKSVNVVAADKKGFTLVYKKTRNVNKPAKNVAKVTFKAGPRRSLGKLKKQLTSMKYRKDLTKAALRRASAILQSQKVAAKPAAAKAGAKKAE